MPTINDPDLLFQGGATNSAGVSFGTPTGRQLAITSAATLPAINAGDFFEVRNSPDSVNNGLWQETGGSPTTSSITATKISGSDPIAGGPDTVDFLGNTTEVKNIMWDTAGRGVYLLEKNGLTADGVTGQCVYSKSLIDWKDDNFLMANAPFPFNLIDADAGKLVIGQDPNGNNSGWTWVDSATYSIRTRKLIRNQGWREVSSTGAVLAIWPCVVTLGAFEDPNNDTAYYQFGKDTTVDDTVDFDFAGPVNESVQAFERLADGAINGGTGVAISSDGRTLTRSDGGNWRTDGFLVGGRIQLRDCENATSNGVLTQTGFGGGSYLLSAVGTGVDGAVTCGTAAVATPNGFDFVDGGGGNDSIQRNDGEDWTVEGYKVGGVIVVANATNAANNGTYTILAISTTTTPNDTIEVATASLTADTDDNTATFGPFDPTGSPDTTMNASIDNLNGIKLKLRVRDGDPNGKTFGQANLASAGKTILTNIVFAFPLANATDLKISETEANIDANTPYTGMTLTVYSTPQSLGGSGYLVGGPYNFGFEVAGNNGTDVEVFEWTQRQLRKTTDIDNDADTVIGRALDGLMRFVGDSLQVGSVDGGLSFPENPQGGGSGVLITGLNAASRNTTTYYDNTGTVRTHPIGTPVTLDFNQFLIDDTVAEYTLFFDYTIRNAVSDLVINAGTGANGTFTSAGSNLPASLDAGVGAYVRISGLTGGDAAMNGVYQVTSISTSTYNVTRHDGTTIATTSSAAVNLDEHPIDSPDAIIVKDDVSADVTGLASSDVTFTFAYSTNVQGGRTAATDAQVRCRAVGQSTAQYTQSSIQTIESATPLTIPVTAGEERNFFNP